MWACRSPPRNASNWLIISPSTQAFRSTPSRPSCARAERPIETATMPVSDLRFWLLLGTGFAGFALLPQRVRVPWLLLVSLCFLGLERPSDLIWSAAVAAVAMGAPRLQVPRGLTIACLVGLLVVGRYGDLVGLHDVAGPAGLSFLVFTA